MRVAEVAGAVMATLFIEVALATPRTGVVNVTNVPFVVAPVIPPKAPPLLYCNSVVEPPGLPLPAGTTDQAALVGVASVQMY